MESPLPLTRASVQSAHEIIKPHIHETPVLTNRTLNALASTPQSPSDLIGTPWEGQRPARPKINFFFKCENFQRVGAFKVRGAFHALGRLSKEELKKGVVTHSSGTILSFTFSSALSASDPKISHLHIPSPPSTFSKSFSTSYSPSIHSLADCSSLPRQPRPSPLTCSPDPQNSRLHCHAHHLHPNQDRGHPRLQCQRHLLRLHLPRARSRRRRRDPRYRRPPRSSL